MRKMSRVSAAKLSGVGEKGEYEYHTVANLRDLKFMTDVKYLARKRKDTEVRYKEFAATCYDCSI